jgi:ribosomal protein L37AE/L43A
MEIEEFNMDKHDVIKTIGRFPDEISSTKKLTSNFWECDKCGNQVAGLYTPNEPCVCSSIFWKGRNDINGK